MGVGIVIGVQAGSEHRAGVWTTVRSKSVVDGAEVGIIVGS
jgi:hypothetical protein